MATSLWTAQPETRYYFGFFFDFVIGMCFVANWVFLIVQADLVFKLKKFYYEQRRNIINKRIQKRMVISQRTKDNNTKIENEAKPNDH